MVHLSHLRLLQISYLAPNLVLQMPNLKVCGYLKLMVFIVSQNHRTNLDTFYSQTVDELYQKPEQSPRCLYFLPTSLRPRNA